MRNISFLCYTLLFLLSHIVVVTAIDIDFHEAAQTTRELQRKQRERKRIKELRQGKDTDENTTIWDAYFNESTTGGKYSFNRTVEANEWILTGTSPILEKPTETPKRGSLLASKQPPYVHWVCYRGITSSSETEATSEKLACCLEIYRAMLQDPESLCWKTDLEACGYNPNQVDPQNIKIDIMADWKKKEQKEEIAASRKTEFMQHCTHLLTPIPPTTQQAESDHPPDPVSVEYSQDGLLRIPPRWSLLQSPPVLKYKPTNQWRQFVQDKVSGIWIKRSDLSPIHIARPIRLNATTEHHHHPDVVDTFPVFYTTKLESSDTNGEWRVLEHTLQLGRIDDPPTSLSAKVTLLLFLPDEMRPIQTPFSNCTPDCHVSLITDTWSKEKKSVWGQPSVVAIQVDIPNVTTRKLSWTTTLWLQDEESLVFPPPLVESAVMTAEDRVWVWDGNVKPTLSLLLTDFEEKERLQDLWNVEL